jgi:hypothetical protein
MGKANRQRNCHVLPSQDASERRGKMLRMVTKTKLSPEEAIKRAVAFFGPDGYGLGVKVQSTDSVYFEGGGGGVKVAACAEGKETSVELVSQEWDYQVKEFIGTIG